MSTLHAQTDRRQNQSQQCAATGRQKEELNPFTPKQNTGIVSASSDGGTRILSTSHRQMDTGIPSACSEGSSRRCQHTGCG